MLIGLFMGVAGPCKSARVRLSVALTSKFHILAQRFALSCSVLNSIKTQSKKTKLNVAVCLSLFMPVWHSAMFDGTKNRRDTQYGDALKSMETIIIVKLYSTSSCPFCCMPLIVFILFLSVFLERSKCVL